MSQPDLFTPPSGEERRDANMSRAARAAADPWRIAAVEAIRQVALRHQEFTADDVWERLGAQFPRERRAIGPMLKLAQADGIVDTTDRCQVSRRAERSGGTQRVWRSRIYRSEPDQRVYACDREGCGWSGPYPVATGVCPRCRRGMDVGNLVRR